jgi:hypothetical protein
MVVTDGSPVGKPRLDDRAAWSRAAPLDYDKPLCTSASRSAPPPGLAR